MNQLIFIQLKQFKITNSFTKSLQLKIAILSYYMSIFMAGYKYVENKIIRQFILYYTLYNTALKELIEN